MLALHLQHEPSEMTLDQQCRVVCLSDMLLDTNKVAWPMDAAMGSPIVDVGSGTMDRPSADAGRMTKAAADVGNDPHHVHILFLVCEGRGHCSGLHD